MTETVGETVGEAVAETEGEREVHQEDSGKEDAVIDGIQSTAAEPAAGSTSIFNVNM